MTTAIFLPKMVEIGPVVFALQWFEVSGELLWWQKAETVETGGVVGHRLSLRKR